MKFVRGLFLGMLCSVLASCVSTPPSTTRLNQANVLPLELNENFQFRKILTSFYDPDNQPFTPSEWANFRRYYMEFGAATRFEKDVRTGNYFTFFWRAREQADVTIRLEYRQATLGNLVIAKEQYYPQAKGSHRSVFTVTGDDYFEFGRVKSWRVLLIVNGRIVAFRQSYAWK